MSWQRLESSSVGSDLLEGQEARIADPLWLLGRQWQVGELTGEDAAGPVLVEARFEHTSVTRFRPGLGPAGPRGAGLPLETAAECEAVRTGPAAVRIAAEAGLHLLRLLRAASAPDALINALRERCPLELPAGSEVESLDPIGFAQLRLLARRGVDARSARALLTARPPAEPLPGMGSAPVRAALEQFRRWYDELLVEPAEGRTDGASGTSGSPEAAVPGSSWSAARMGYSFQVAAGIGGQAELRLQADGYTGGRLDWYTFDVAGPGLPMGATGEPVRHDVRVLPTPVRYAGQAASRFWQLENATVWFGDLNAGPSDLARAAVAAYGLVFGDDWFLVPCRLPFGVLARCRGVRVLDSFGESHDVRSCAEQDGAGRAWRFFELTGDRSADVLAVTTPDDGGRPESAGPWLFLPPVLAGRVEGRPIEEVALRRDEVANLGWASELRIESPAGRTVDRAARSRAAFGAATAGPRHGLRYVLAPDVPEHHVPLVPVRSDGALYLQRGQLAVSAAGGLEVNRALGTVLEPDRPLLLEDATVPATGMHVTRSWQLARTAGGGFVLWVGRQTSAGPPPASPGLVFDQVD
jgi:hypothetical protein